MDYSLEVLRDGSVLGVHDIAGKDHYTFGRMPECDFVLEHPSASRLHAVLQFNGETKVWGQVWVYLQPTLRRDRRRSW